MNYFSLYSQISLFLDFKEGSEDKQLKNRVGIKAMKLETLNKELDCVLQ